MTTNTFITVTQLHTTASLNTHHWQAAGKHLLKWVEPLRSVYLADLIGFLHVYISIWLTLIIIIIIITVFHLGIFKNIVTFICVCENDKMRLHPHWSPRLHSPFQPLLIRKPTILFSPNARWRQTQSERKKKNRSQKLGNTQIVVIQFTAGRTQLFQQAAVITFSGVKTSFYSFANSFDSNSSLCVHHFFCLPICMGGNYFILFLIEFNSLLFTRAAGCSNSL